MRWKKWFGMIHLWLGLATGPVVFILGITGAIYCFAPELQNLQPYRTVREENRAFLPPSEIQQVTERQLPGKSPQRIYYDARDKAVMVLFSKKEEYNYSIFINPYSGEVLKVRDNEEDFLSVVLQLHRTLLIPYGHDIIRWSTVIFILMLISGIVLWWPKNKRTAKHGYKIMWRAHPKRLNYDLHKVMGFYVTWIVIFTALTGLMFAFEGFSSFVYKTTGADRSLVRTKPPFSDTTSLVGKSTSIDLVWKKIQPDLYQKYATAMFVLPAAKNGSILLRANPGKATIYKSDFRYFDQYTGQEIPGAYTWGKYSDATTTADYIRRMNYDIHTGAIFGLPGRITLFFLALIVASLPITGFFFWWGRKSKKVRSRKALKTTMLSATA
jgi:uncharacterized iron-regulated membrane protein